MRFLYFFLVLLISHSSSAQITIEAITLPKEGDILLYQNFAGYEDTLAYQTNGEDVTWEIGKLDIVGNSEETYSDIADTDLVDSFPDANMVLELGGFQAAALRTANTVEVVGISTGGFGGFGIDAAIDFDDNYVVRQTPLTYGSQFDDSFEIIFTLAADLIPGLDSLDLGIGGVLDSIRVTTNSSKSEEVIGWGTLNLWGQEKEVLKVEQIDNSETKLEVGVLVLGFPVWIDATEFLGATGFGGVQSRYTYKFLAADLKTSVIEFTENRFQDTIGNNLITISGRVSGDIMSGTENLTFEEGLISAFPNPTSDYIILRSDNVELTNADKVTIMDLHGRAVLTTAYRLGDRINLSSLVDGQYLISVHAENRNYISRMSIIR